MIPAKETTHVPTSWPWWRCALTGLSALALALSAYLAWHYLVGGSVIGCGGGSPCDEVLSSRWSAVRGVLPVSGLAMGAYLAILLASFFIGPATAAPDRRLAWSAMLVLTAAAAGSAVWFIILQRWVIGSFCPYCMATHLTGLLLAALVLWRALAQVNQVHDDSTDAAPPNPAPQPVEGVAAPAAPRSAIRPFPAIGLAIIGLTFAGILAASQMIFSPPPAYRAGESQNNLPAIDPHTVPLIGSPDAPYIVNLFFDYQCPHCQKLHAMLDEAIARYHGKLAFVLCPAPLNTQCNPYVARDVDEFKDSCALAQLGLAVWVAQREAFPEFDRWMFSPDPGQPWHPRTLEAASAKAVELVGQEKFDAARADRWIQQFMQASIQIYGASIRLQQSSNAVPKLVFGPRWVIPEPNNPDDLMSMLHDSLALPTP